ncbi:MAG: hypothetical protein LBT52_00610 [Clostridiales Family XIII bacterium]|nr:hypothetical protein [Clostridiales Family XIII bacterium]
MVVPEKHYKRSEDGKVVYLFDDDEETEDASSSQRESGDVPPDAQGVNAEDTSPGGDEGNRNDPAGIPGSEEKE